MGERLAKRLESVEARMKRKSQGSSTLDRTEQTMTILDFDPVFRKKDFQKVRHGVMKALCVPTTQEKGTLRSQTLTRQQKLKSRFAAKLKE